MRSCWQRRRKARSGSERPTHRRVSEPVISQPHRRSCGLEAITNAVFALGWLVKNGPKSARAAVLQARGEELAARTLSTFKGHRSLEDLMSAVTLLAEAMGGK